MAPCYYATVLSSRFRKSGVYPLNRTWKSINSDGDGDSSGDDEVDPSGNGEDSSNGSSSSIHSPGGSSSSASSGRVHTYRWYSS